MSLPTSTQSTAAEDPKKPPKFPIKLLGGGLIIAGVILAITNPGKSEYYRYATDKIVGPLAETENCEDFKQRIGLLGLQIPTQDLCKFTIGGFAQLARPVVREGIKSTTKNRNLGVFSIYTTSFPRKTVKTVGIANQFISISDQ